MVTILAIGIGLIFGSFLSVLLERLDRKEGIVAGRSECPHCHHVLAWYDLVPVASYIMLRGRCRYCRAAISPRYPILEVTMAAIFGLYAARYGIDTFWQLSDGIMLFGLVSLFFFDLTYQILPDVLVYSMIGVAAVRLAVLRPELLVNAVLAGVILASILALVYFYSRGRWLGFGDVKLALLMGLLFGYPVVVGVTLAAVYAGALVGVVMILARKATMKSALPFGSFWTASAIVAIIWPGSVAHITGLLIPLSR